jgi:hypothetical protein
MGIAHLSGLLCLVKRWNFLARLSLPRAPFNPSESPHLHCSLKCADKSRAPEHQQADVTFLERSASRINYDAPNIRTESDPESGRSSKPPEISPHREYVLWKTWIDEVAPWVRSSHKFPVATNKNQLTNSTTSATLSKRFRSWPGIRHI